MKTRLLIAGLLLFLVSACGSGATGSSTTICPPAAGTPQRLQVPPEALPTATVGPSPTPVVMRLGGKDVRINKVVSGPLCNDAWSGNVYVTCDVQVYPWDKNPTFFQGCNLQIAPGTVVYVASHNDAPYYNGCTCHSERSTKP